MTQQNDIQYKVNGLTRAKQATILQAAWERCQGNWHVDVLDCSKSWARQRIEMPIGEALEYFKNARGFCMFSMFWRRYFESYFELGYRLDRGDGTDLFLWINVSEEDGLILARRYGIEAWDH